MSDVYDPNQVRLRPVDNTRRTGPGEEAFGGQIGQALQRGGRALDRTADALAQIADSQAETRTREADIAMSTRIQEELTTGDNALMKLQGQAFVDAAPAYLKRLEDHAKELTANPRNQLESRMLSDLTNRRLSEVRGQVSSNMIREAQFANKAAAAGRVITTGTDAAYAYRDPALFARTRGAHDAALADDLRAKGITDPAAFQAARLQSLSVVNSYAIEDMMRLGETGQAQSWLDKAIIAREMDPITANRLQEKLEKAITENEISTSAAGQAPPTVVDGKLDRATPELIAAQTYQESRGNGNAVSPKGAQGTGQVMPTTEPEAARLAGVPYQPHLAKGTTPEALKYQKALHEAYMNQQLKTFGGSVVVALAAYNAGPAKAAEWVKKFGDPAKGEITSAAWAAAIPFPETKDYVAKITARLGGTTKAPLPPGVMTIEEAEVWVKQWPVKDRDQARSAAYAAVNRNRTMKSQREEDAWDKAQPYLRNGGTWNNVPQKIWSNVSPQHQTALMEAARKGENRETDPTTLSAIYDIMENDPQGFAKMDLLVKSPDLSKSDFEQFRQMQHQARTGQGEWKRPVAQFSSVRRLSAQVAPPSIRDGKTKFAKAEMDRFQARWFTAVQYKQASQQEPLTDDEIAEIGTRMTAEVALANPGLFGPKTKPLYQVGVDDKGLAGDVSIIPAAEYEKVRLKLLERDGKPPTNREVLDTWRSAKAIN